MRQKYFGLEARHSRTEISTTEQGAQIRLKNDNPFPTVAVQVNTLSNCNMISPKQQRFHLNPIGWSCGVEKVQKQIVTSISYDMPLIKD
ncbi:hypothetical protein AVEN_235855-1 [Araneus ventricosus]|uniref:Uncharacterized protein n=1 Tax=Araneus ventricosus TaxID=182803 RepID=A0A4Y2VUD6_ARAVE|nr:hypothetical protein AVEN_235855-1 [Araneus ventricosus]